MYGSREPLKGEYAPVVGLFKRQHNAKKPMTVVSPGTQRRDFTYINDIVSANICAMINFDQTFNIYNVGTGKNYSMLELARLIDDLPNISFIPERSAEVDVTLADIIDTKKDLNWEPSYSLEDMIKSY